jgi:hypothetical protein
MSKKLSVTMIGAIEYAREHGNKLIRHQGGFWADTNWSKGRENFGTQTVQSLVDRGYATYTLQQKTNNGTGSFPVEATLTDEALT